MRLLFILAYVVVVLAAIVMVVAGLAHLGFLSMTAIDVFPIPMTVKALLATADGSLLLTVSLSLMVAMIVMVDRSRKSKQS